jgi:hypothetical protein
VALINVVSVVRSALAKSFILDKFPGKKLYLPFSRLEARLVSRAISRELTDFDKAQVAAYFEQN